MSRLFAKELREIISTLREQENINDPVVYTVFHFPGTGWRWFVTEGQQTGEDFIFFGYVTGFEAEWGYFTLRELEEVEVRCMTVERVKNFQPTTLSECLNSVGVDFIRCFTFDQTE